MTDDNILERVDKGVSTIKDQHAEMAGDDRAIMQEARLIGGGLITVLIITLVLTEVYNAVDVSEGPFSDVVNDLETTGVAALSLIVVGFLVVAAVAIMRFFRSGFGGAAAR